MLRTRLPRLATLLYWQAHLNTDWPAFGMRRVSPVPPTTVQALRAFAFAVSGLATDRTSSDVNQIVRLMMCMLLCRKEWHRHKRPLLCLLFAGILVFRLYDLAQGLTRAADEPM